MKPEYYIKAILRILEKLDAEQLIYVLSYLEEYFKDESESLNTTA